MNVSAIRAPLSRTETAGLLVAATVVAVTLGPDAITLADGSSVLLSAVSVLATGTLAPVARLAGYRAAYAEYMRPSFWRRHVEQPEET